MTLNKQTQSTFYDLLRIHKTANTEEIYAAYQKIKSIFQENTTSSFSLLSKEETHSFLKDIENAFETLSHRVKREKYDQSISSLQQGVLIMKQETTSKLLPESASVSSSSSIQSQPTPPTTPSEHISTNKENSLVSQNTPGLSVPQPSRFTGSVFTAIRENRGLSIEEVFKTTKIPIKFLRAIEQEEISKLPARVYLQGFVKNIAALYQLDPSLAAKSYLEYIEEKKGKV